MNEILLRKPNPVSDDDPKPFSNDVLDREPVAQKLTPLLASIRQAMVLSIDAPYGGGKSYFLSNWQKMLELEGYLCVSFNAWENDYADDPLLAFISSIDQQLKDRQQSETGDIKDALDKFEGFSKSIAKTGGKVALKGLLRHIVGDSGVEDLRDLFDKKTEEELITLVANKWDDVLDGHQEKEQSIRDFRKHLANTIKTITSDFDEDKRKLIIFVDELDRCHPTYAIDVLERIKHFFAVDGVVFVLGIYEEQIAKTMRAVYGSDLDTDGYLRRFIDWRFKLPEPSKSYYSSYLAILFGWREMDNWVSNNGYYDVSRLVEEIATVSAAFQWSLRKMEQCFTELDLILRCYPQNLFWPQCLSWIMAMRDDPEFATQLDNYTYRREFLMNDMDGLLDFARKASDKVVADPEANNFDFYRNKDLLTGAIISWFIGRERLGFLQEKKKSDTSNEDIWLHAFDYVRTYDRHQTIMIAKILQQRLSEVTPILQK